MTAVETAKRALERMRTLLAVVDREHTAEELYGAVRGARHELETASTALYTPGPGPVYLRARQAGAPARPRRHTIRHMVLAMLQAGPHSDAHLSRVICGQGVASTPDAVRARRVELLQAELVTPAAQRSRNGHTMWQLTEAGRRALGKLSTQQQEMSVEGGELRA